MFIKRIVKKLLPSNTVKALSIMYRRISVYSFRNWFTIYFGRVEIDYLVVSVGQACNFKCRDCSNFAPVSPESFRRYDVNDIKRDLTILFENIKYINLVQIQGGSHFYIVT